MTFNVDLVVGQKFGHLGHPENLYKVEMTTVLYSNY